MITETLQEKKTIVRDFYDLAFNQKRPEEPEHDVLAAG